MTEDQVKVEAQDDDVRELTLDETQVVGAVTMAELPQ